MLFIHLGEAIKDRRKELSITQHHLAELSDISVNTLYKLERGAGKSIPGSSKQTCRGIRYGIEIRSKKELTNK